MDSVEFSLWMERREVEALKAALRKQGKDDLDAVLRAVLREFYDKTVPEAVRQAVAQEIHAEERAFEQEQEANRRRSGIIFRRGGQTAYYESDQDFDDLSMPALIRRHIRKQLAEGLEEHFCIRGDGPISREDLRGLIEMRKRNSTVVTGIFLIDLDEGVYGTLQVTEGWRFYPLRAVSTACYYEQRSSKRNYFRRLDLFWSYLDGKDLPRDQYHINI